MSKTSVYVELSDEDLDNIKALSDLASSANNTFLTIDEGAIDDNDNNPVVQLSPEEAIAVANLTSDGNSPELRGFDLDLNSGNLTLSFSETVLASTLQASGLTLQSSASQELVAHNSSLFFTLVDSENITTLSNLVLVLELSNSDLNQIKSRSRLATSENNTFLSLTEATIMDAGGNRITPVSNTNATAVSNYTSDLSPPQLMSFNVDLNRGEITFRFSETVDRSTLQLSSFTLQDSCPRATIIDMIGSGANSTNSTDFNSYTFVGN